MVFKDIDFLKGRWHKGLSEEKASATRKFVDEFEEDAGYQFFVRACRKYWVREWTAEKLKVETRRWIASRPFFNGAVSVDSVRRYFNRSIWHDKQDTIYPVLRRQPKEDGYYYIDISKPISDYWINIYTVTRHYGGPQEGGWYYNQRYLEASIPLYRGADVRSLIAVMTERFQDEKWGDIYSVNGGQDVDIRIEEERGESEAMERSHYE